MSDWLPGDLYANPPRLHVCGRCGAERVNRELHDEWHEHQGAALPSEGGGA